MGNTHLLERRRHADITAPGQPFSTVFESPLQPSSPFIKLTDQDEQLISCGIDMHTEGENIAIEILDRGEVGCGFHGTSLWGRDTCYYTNIMAKNIYETVG